MVLVGPSEFQGDHITNFVAILSLISWYSMLMLLIVYISSEVHTLGAVNFAYIVFILFYYRIVWETWS